MAPLSGVFATCEAISTNFTDVSLREMALPKSILMCPPTYFEVIDVKNAFMQGQIGKVDREKALSEWAKLKCSYESRGIVVEILDPLEGCEDMVFCANPVFTGVDVNGQRKCVLSRMNYRSRRKEVAAAASWFVAHGYEMVDFSKQNFPFEGGGDAIWHPGRRMIWGGYGSRTDPGIYQSLAEIFGVPIVTLKLQDYRFYHLDTCFCPIDEKTVLLYPPAFTEEGLAIIRNFFPSIIEADENEAVGLLACNAASLLARYVFIQQGATKVNRRLSELGYEVIEVATDEFLKSGGSVFCMKSFLF